MVFGTQDFAQLLKDIIESKKRHPLYEETVKHAEAMSVHIYGDKPMYLLDRARPREDGEVKLYRVTNYEPTTKAGADKAIDIVTKIFNPTLYSIRWKEETAQTKELKRYTFEYFPNYNSIVTYNKDVTLRKMLADPNGLMAVKPGPPMPEEKTLDPEVVIYGSANIYYYDRDHYLIFDHIEERENKKFHYFQYFDRDSFLYFHANYDPSNRTVQTFIDEQYFHGFNEIPAWLLRGKSRSCDNGAVVYESFFSPALAHWNLAVIHESDLLGAFITHMHPQKYEETEECNYKFEFEGQYFDCRGGTIKYGKKDDLEGHVMDCPQCGGSGRHAVKSPYGTYQFLKEKLDEIPSGRMPVGYITVPVEATKLLKEHCQEMNKKAMWAINMDVEDEVGENQSGVAKTIDRSGQQDTIFNIGSVVFDVHLPNQYYFINKYKFKEEARSTRKDESKNLPEINKPSVIDILTMSDLINNFDVAAKAGIDKNVLRLKQMEIINRDPSLPPELRSYMVALLELDPLYGFKQNEIDLSVNKGVVRKVDWAIHENLKTFLDKALAADKNFLEKKKEEKIAVLEQFATEMIEGEKPRIEEEFLMKEEQFAA